MNTRTKHRHKASRFKVLVAVECIKEYDIVALDAKEASELAENRAIQKSKLLKQRGFIIGDVETALVEECKNDR